MLFVFFGPMAASFIVAIMLIRYQHVHAHFSADHDMAGVQKFHQLPVPRIGSIPIFTGLLAGVVLLFNKYSHDITLGLLLVSALPALLAGLVEDITKRVGARLRLIAAFGSAALAYYLLGVGVTRLAIPGIDTLLTHLWVLSFVLSLITVGGVTHAFNIIDGYNGLASMVALLILLALSYVSFKVGDSLLLGICTACAGSILGFFVWNFPRGMIFAGDGGAYLMGFIIAQISVLLIARHPEVSPWFPLLLVIYPVFETLFSIYRKKILRGISPGIPDGLHLHMLIYKRLVRWMLGKKERRHPAHLNSATSPYLWALTGLSVAPALLFWQNTAILVACSIAFVFIYITLYRMLILFKIPAWVKARQRRYKE